VQRFSDISNSYVLLKGKVAVLFSPGKVEVEELYEGEIPKMAVAGMGDVLSGLIGGYLARGFYPTNAIRRSFCRRSRAAKLYLERHPYAESVTPRDILEILKKGEDLALQ
jgi:NAD(P)H-hydrate repair Nnr-like enzyme with NAD(P)H-hydrate dehydratase domain